MVADDINPYLQGATGDNKGSRETIENEQDPGNIVWQTRDHAPTDYENALGDVLEKIFADGIQELTDVVARLNTDFPKPDGSAWTEENFQEEIKRLGA